MYQRRDFYRHARFVHGWLSALAFLALFFFSLTGLLLNHADWFETDQPEKQVNLSLSPEMLAKLQAQENPTEALLSYVRQKEQVIGKYQSSEVMDGEVMIHLESPAGVTDIWAMLDSGEIEVTSKAASVSSLIKDLHRGKNSGQAWSLFIDISSIVILLLSLAGLILFLTIKARLRTHLLLVGLSIILLMLLIWSAV